ncbi:hypothetical protein HPP92_026839 [Vanilla planifolia]|uniref:Uncharacterized protein n=1 Tax=Vanilla planifolia TaxID=51239 RepID=A0A835PEF0_VANPL|nr:hypothetical protein HPP92_026839 [Vanilla planifolia]
MDDKLICRNDLCNAAFYTRLGRRVERWMVRHAADAQSSRHADGMRAQRGNACDMALSKTQMTHK